MSFPYFKLENLGDLSFNRSSTSLVEEEEERSASSRSLLSSWSLRGDDNNSQDNSNDEICFNLLPGLSWTERMIGCGTCVVAGYLLSFGSFFRIKELIFGNPYPFVIHVTVGNTIALCGSCFLTGARSQVNRMFSETRRTISTLYLGSILLTILLAFNRPIPNRPPKGLILLILVLCQYVFITWYCLSYIPYARETVYNCCKRRVVEPTMDRFVDNL